MVVIVVGERYVVVVVAMCVPLFGGTCLPFVLAAPSRLFRSSCRKEGGDECQVS